MSQRELLARAIHDAFRVAVEYESEPCEDDYETADKLMAKGVRVVKTCSWCGHPEMCHKPNGECVEEAE